MQFALRALITTAACYALVLVALYASGSQRVKRHQIETAGFALCALASAILVTSRHKTPQGHDSPTRRVVYGAIVTAILGTVTLWQASSVGFLSDDYVLRSWAQSGQWLGESSSFARPLVLLLWRVVDELEFGSRLLHVISLSLHGINTVLSVLLAVKLGLSSRGALAAGLVVSFWPTQVEPVVWSAGMFDVLMCTFVLGVVYLTPSGAVATKTRILAIVSCATAALLSKETAIALPILWITFYAPTYATARTHRRALVIIGASLALLCATYLLWRYFAGLPLSGVSEVSRYLLKEQLSRTIAGLALPFSSHTLIAFSWLPVVAASTLLAAVLVFTLPHGDGHEVIALQGVLWALVAAAPTVGYLFIGPDLDGSRYLYLPSFGWGIFLGAALERGLKSSWSAPIAPLMVITLGLAAYDRHVVLKQWTDAASLRDRILAAAVLASHKHDCGDVSVSGLPVRYKGAQLFNNGFREAFEASPYRRVGSRPCRLEWTSGTMIQR